MEVTQPHHKIRFLSGAPRRREESGPQHLLSSRRHTACTRLNLMGLRTLINHLHSKQFNKKHPALDNPWAL